MLRCAKLLILNYAAYHGTNACCFRSETFGEDGMLNVDEIADAYWSLQ